VAAGADVTSLDLYSIAPTLFTPDGRSVDADAMAAAAASMVDHGITDLLLTGSYGEFQSLCDEERVAVVRAVRPVRGVRSVMACAALPSTDATARLAERLRAEGADSVMVSAPLSCELSETELLRHFEELAGRDLGPLVVYNNPVFGTDLSPAQLAAIVALDGFVAVKQGTKSMRSLAQSVTAVHEAAGSRAKLLAASDVTGMLALAAGADGLSSTNSWAFPGALRGIVEAAARRDWERARRIAGAVEPYFELAGSLGQPRTVKAAMTLRGVGGCAAVRLPYRPLDDDELKRLAAVLEDCDGRLAAGGGSLHDEAGRTEGGA